MKTFLLYKHRFFFKVILLKAGHIFRATVIFSILWRPLTAGLCLVSACYNLSAALLEGEYHSEPPTCLVAPAVDSPQAEPVNTSLVTWNSLSPCVSSELCSPAWRLHPCFPNKRMAVCVCTSLRFMYRLLSGSKQFIRWCRVWTMSGWSWFESKRPWHDWDVFVDVVIFEYWKHLLHIKVICLCHNPYKLRDNFK